MTKKDIQFGLKNRLSTDSRWCLRALVVIYSYQTTQERADRHTIIQNDLGFDSNDAPILTGIAKQYLTTRSVTPNQLNICFKRIPKYWGQILRITPDKSRFIHILEQDMRDYL